MAGVGDGVSLEAKSIARYLLKCGCHSIRGGEDVGRERRRAEPETAQPDLNVQLAAQQPEPEAGVANGSVTSFRPQVRAGEADVGQSLEERLVEHRNIMDEMPEPRGESGLDLGFLAFDGEVHDVHFSSRATASAPALATECRRCLFSSGPPPQKL